MMATHDIIDYIVTWPVEIYNYFGLGLISRATFTLDDITYKYAENACHQIFQRPNDFTAVDSIDVATMHASFGYPIDGKLLLGYDSFNLPYLIVKETVSAAGVTTRCAYLEIGQTYVLKPEETKLVNNVVYWLLKDP